MSATALSIYLRMFMNNGSSLLRPESIVQMRTVISGVVPYESLNTTNNKTSLPPFEFGLIWHWETSEAGRRLFGHDGSMPGTLTSMFINEKGDIGVIILTNADIYPNDTLSDDIYLTLSDIQHALFDCFEI
jgi:CubicO group peptidase (beta-lactamase class C family)